MKKSKYRTAWFAAAAIIACASVAELVSAQGATQPTPGERAIQYRQAVFKVIAGNFGPLAQNAQGKLELPAPAARKNAQRLAAIAGFVRDAFPDISRDGETHAKASIWTDRAEFEKLVSDLETRTQALAAVTARADAQPEDLKAAVGAVGNACKGCHDKFREK